MGRKRDATIDIMKGILILLVVMAHAQGPGHRLIYLFHMAAFFMISGYLFTDSYEINITQLVKRKIVSLYLPYVAVQYVVSALVSLHTIFSLQGKCVRGMYLVYYMKS